MFFAQLNYAQYLGQIQVTIEKLLILHIVVFMTSEIVKQLLNNF